MGDYSGLMLGSILAAAGVGMPSGRVYKMPKPLTREQYDADRAAQDRKRAKRKARRAQQKKTGKSS